MTEYNVFDVLEKKSKDHYSLLVGKKAQPPYIVHTLQRNFNFSSDQIKHFLFYLTVLPSNHTSRPFNTKFLPLYSTLTQNCTKSVLDRIICAVFARLSQKLLTTFFYHCSHSRHFWTDFESYWHLLSNQRVHLCLENVLYGIISQQCPLLNLLNYFVIVGKLFLWDCRRSQINPEITGFKNKIVLKCEIERKIKNTKDYFKKKWVLIPTR